MLVHRLYLKPGTTPKLFSLTLDNRGARPLPRWGSPNDVGDRLLQVRGESTGSSARQLC